MQRWAKLLGCNFKKTIESIRSCFFNGNSCWIRINFLVGFQEIVCWIPMKSWANNSERSLLVTKMHHIHDSWYRKKSQFLQSTFNMSQPYWNSQNRSKYNKLAKPQANFSNPSGNEHLRFLLLQLLWWLYLKTPSSSGLFHSLDGGCQHLLVGYASAMHHHLGQLVVLTSTFLAGFGRKNNGSWH